MFFHFRSSHILHIDIICSRELTNANAVGLQFNYVTTKIHKNPSLDSKVILQGKHTDTHVT